MTLASSFRALASLFRGVLVLFFSYSEHFFTVLLFKVLGMISLEGFFSPPVFSASCWLSFPYDNKHSCMLLPTAITLTWGHISLFTCHFAWDRHRRALNNALSRKSHLLGIPHDDCCILVSACPSPFNLADSCLITSCSILCRLQKHFIKSKTPQRIHHYSYCYFLNLFNSLDFWSHTMVETSCLLNFYSLFP